MLVSFLFPGFDSNISYELKYAKDNSNPAEEYLENVFDVNLFGVVNLIQKLLPFFSKDSHVVNISSVGGLIGSSKFPGLSAYSSRIIKGNKLE